MPTREELLEALMERIPGPDFPTHAQILGTRGIKDAYRTGRGSITMRAVVNVEEIQGRTCLVITELPYQVNPDNVAVKISDLAREGKITGIADIRDETSDRTGQRLVIVLEAGCRRQGRAEQPLQAHPAAGELRREHARDRRRRAAHAAARRVHHALDRPPDRGHRPPHAVTACARPRSACTSCAATSRRSTRSTRSSR